MEATLSLVADVKDVKNDGASKVDDMMTSLARGRVALGVAAFAMPALTAKVLGLSNGADGGRDYLARMFGAREIALGTGYLFAKGPARRTWARLGLVVDAMDTVAGLQSRKTLPLRASAMGTVIAASAAIVGAAKVTQDVAG